MTASLSHLTQDLQEAEVMLAEAKSDEDRLLGGEALRLVRDDICNAMAPYDATGLAGGEAWMLPGLDCRQAFLTQSPQPYQRRVWMAGDLGYAQVEQGHVLVLPRTQEWILEASLSECSFLVGFAPNAVVAAHTSFSTVEQTLGAFDLMARHGVRHLAVVASSGPAQKQAEPQGGYGYRMRSADDYLACGISGAAIFPFFYLPDSQHRLCNQPVVTARSVAHTFVPAMEPQLIMRCAPNRPAPAAVNSRTVAAGLTLLADRLTESAEGRAWRPHALAAERYLEVLESHHFMRAHPSHPGVSYARRILETDPFHRRARQPAEID